MPKLPPYHRLRVLTVILAVGLILCGALLLLTPAPVLATDVLPLVGIILIVSGLAPLLSISARAAEHKLVERAKSEFVSLSSHELRTPLTSIKWTLEMFKAGTTGPLNLMQIELVNRAHVSAIRMAQTITTMLMLSRLEAKRLKLIPRSIKLQELLQTIKDEQQEHARRMKHTVTVVSPELELRTDEQLLKEIVINLLSNAIKYTPEGGHIHIAAKTEPDDTVSIMVSDSGYGIPVKEQPHIFTKFYRAENIQDKETSGTGLGLYLVQALVELLGGVISFQSQENKGTTFTVKLPATLPTQHA